LLGEKSGKGFFLYPKGKQGELNPELGTYMASAKKVEREFDANMGDEQNVMSVADIADACLLPMLVEALRCLAEVVVVDAAHLDAAFVYGIGFPAFRGGLLRYFAGFEEAELRQKMTTLNLNMPDNMEVLHDFRE